MADTLNDEHHHEPPPPTEREPEHEPVPETELEPSVVTPRRWGRWLAALFVALAIGGSAAAAYFGWLYVSYEAVAYYHVPGNAQVVARVELADVALYAPVREHLLPALKERLARPSTAKKGSDLRKRLLETTGVDLEGDVREVVFASVEGKAWIAIFGGKMQRGRFVDGLAKVLEEEGVGGYTKRGALLVGPEGQAIAQAEDGAVLYGTNVAVVEAALPAEAGPSGPVLPKGAVVFSLTRDAAEGALSLPRDMVRGVTGTMSLDDAPTLAASFDLVPGADPAPIAKAIEQAAASMRALAPEGSLAKVSLDALAVEPSATSVRVRVPWTEETTVRACKEAAEELRTVPLPTP